jgi:hypothetical protein
MLIAVFAFCVTFNTVVIYEIESDKLNLWMIVSAFCLFNSIVIFSGIRLAVMLCLLKYNKCGRKQKGSCSKVVKAILISEEADILYNDVVALHKNYPDINCEAADKIDHYD